MGRAAARVIERRLAVEIAVIDFVAGTVGRPCVTLMNGVECRPQVSLDNGVVLAVQRLEAEKRTADLIRAWPLTGLAERGWELWIAGTGSERAALESLVASTDGIRLLGHRNDIPDLHQRAAMFVATAPAEPFGLSVAEAMAAGLPTVASRGSAHLETVGRARPDLLYNPGDEHQLAALICDLALDPEKRRTAGLALRAHQQEHLTANGHVVQLLDVYHSVLSRPSASRMTWRT